ncbi:MAG: amino acid adenylation domain-containing protein [Steroidobacterales bacterium]
MNASIDAAIKAPVPAAIAPGGCHQAFERQAALTPAASAVVFERGELDYRELNRRANRLANELRSLGARRGRIIGIYLERSTEMLVAVLAVLKSGAAYLPLDPAYPAARLQNMLDDAAPAVVLTTQRLAGTLPMHAARPVLIEHALAHRARDDDIDAGVRSADVAYLMYTSGSTGRPKGVLVTHGGVANYLAWRHSYFPLHADDRVLQKASLSFDDSVWEILEPLSAGAVVILARAHFEFDSAYLVSLIAQRRITAACFVPSLLHAIVEEPGVGACDSLRRLTTGGETLSVELQRRVLERLPAATLYNGYGATETTIASTFWQCINAPGQSSVPIGRPIANTQVYVLDARRQPVPAGIAGEIYIGGAGVALGYLNRPALTAERFIQNPFNDGADRIYRTGDLGLLRADGVLEFLGRADDQVKIRGVRVELGEIESALLEHPRVRAAAAVCAGGAAALVAYIVARDSSAPPAGELREYLRSRLPPSMMPSRILAIGSLPRTPSGKLDRQRLASLATAHANDDHYIEPQDALELELVEIWKQFLEIRPIGRNDDFFALGGDSLSAMRVAAAIDRAFNRRLPPGLLFEAPTVDLLARRLRADERVGPPSSLIALGAGGAARPLFLVHQIDGDVVHYRELAEQMATQPMATHQVPAPRPIYGLQAFGVEHRATPLESIEAMAAQYLREIRALQPAGPYALAGHSSGGLIAFEMAQQLHLAGQRVEPLAILDINANVGQGRSLPDALRLYIDTLRRLPAAHRGAFTRRNLGRWIASVYRRARGTHTPPPLSEDSDYSPVRAAMERAVRAYRPKAYPGFVTLFRATDRSVTASYGRTLGWKRLARGGIRVIDIHADHKTMLRGEAARAIAKFLNACLEGTGAGSAAGQVSG